MTYDIAIVEQSAQPTAVIHAKVAMDQIPAFIGEALGEVAGALAAAGLEPTGPPFARYEMFSDGVEMSAGFPVPSRIEPAGRIEPMTLPGGQIATTTHIGSYDTVEAAYEAVDTWIDASPYVVAGDPWESYLDGPDVASPRTVVCFPCRLDS
jgi:effector-binding domain-containing protein